jgi:hypothetical protein
MNCRVCKAALIRRKTFCSNECYHKFRTTRPTSYYGLHFRVYAAMGKATKCSMCGTTKGRIEWANKSGKYENNLTDWIQLCSSCHKLYDNALRHGYRLGRERNCYKCGVVKPLTEFHHDRTRSSGRSPLCRTCSSFKEHERRQRLKLV